MIAVAMLALVLAGGLSTGLALVFVVVMIGGWMLENNLTEYYSEQMNKDLREAATSKGDR